MEPFELTLFLCLSGISASVTTISAIGTSDTLTQTLIHPKLNHDDAHGPYQWPPQACGQAGVCVRCRTIGAWESCGAVKDTEHRALCPHQVKKENNKFHLTPDKHKRPHSTLVLILLRLLRRWVVPVSLLV